MDPTAASAQSVLGSYFRAFDPNAVVTASAGNLSVTSSVIAGATLQDIKIIHNYTDSGAFWDSDDVPTTFSSVTQNGNVLTATYESIFDDLVARTLVGNSNITSFLTGSITLPIPPTYPYTYDIQSGDTGELKYKITNVTDGAANSIDNQDLSLIHI